MWWRGRTCFGNGPSRYSDLRVQNGGAAINHRPASSLSMASDGMRVCDSHPVSLFANKIAIVSLGFTGRCRSWKYGRYL